MNRQSRRAAKAATKRAKRHEHRFACPPCALHARQLEKFRRDGAEITTEPDGTLVITTRGDGRKQTERIPPRAPCSLCGDTGTLDVIALEQCASRAVEELAQTRGKVLLLEHKLEEITDELRHADASIQSMRVEYEGRIEAGYKRERAANERIAQLQKGRAA